MKSMMLTGIRQIEMKKFPTPQIVNDNDVLIKMKTVGVCGSDIHYYTTGKIGVQVVKYPYPVGHEGSGIVEKIGSKVKHVKVGDRIAIEPAMACGECDQCKAGRPHTCRKLRFLGCPGQADGLLSEYLVMPEHCCIPIAKTLSLDEAVISESGHRCLRGSAVDSHERRYCYSRIRSYWDECAASSKSSGRFKNLCY